MASQAGTRHALTASLVAGVSCVLVLAGLELVLRSNGHRPWHVATVDANEPTIHVADPVLGWRAKPGRHVVPPYTPDATPIQITFLADGTRSTGLEPATGPVLVFSGASFTQGWAVSDHLTFPWLVQARFPDLQVRNYGTGGYSTYQSLLSLEQLLAREPAPHWVLYSLVEDLERRNVATSGWLRSLAQLSRRAAGDVPHVPYCTLAGDELVRHPPERYPAWPLRNHLATIALAERVYSERRAHDRPLQRRAVTKKLVLEMRDRVEATGARYTVVMLNFPDKDVKRQYAGFLRSNSIDFVDCAFPMTRDMVVLGEGHANAKMHAQWGDCIAAAIEARSIGTEASRPSR